MGGLKFSGLNVFFFYWGGGGGGGGASLAKGKNSLFQVEFKFFI